MKHNLPKQSQMDQTAGSGRGWSIQIGGQGCSFSSSERLQLRELPAAGEVVDHAENHMALPEPWRGRRGGRFAAAPVWRSEL